ncbi:uncharacterized protein TRIADDRAFT_54163 [Trichoplax adhaerens]|uniref:Coiled-coil domain-containing protein 103 n=1 Tax=Trichoplax adhaerens TaxID=10228 RepID=B3RRA3_TRIAD|nr:hypothetical protein TRIADDRAFT_54163 [Trichoplax adhaerens]EDV26842.1 hypothetical protein TRIADDRAFT_54163 [Trichoplax adhaerens]|eukprot:XP_002110838.1 hypothetical protein TRIADDRAFT_54163 [Trichoplax adhaerens]
MAHSDRDEIDFAKLEKELSNALEADKKYWRENDAKIRAVGQRVGTYEEFKGIVAASHLRPLDRKEGLITNERITQTWNAAASKNDQDAAEIAASIPSSNEQDWNVKTAVEFERRFLCRLGGERLYQLYKTEVSNLEGLLQVLHECYQPADAQVIYHMLYCITKSDRFSLTIMFFGKQEKACSTELLVKLKDSLSNQDIQSITFNEDDLVKLRKKYGL